ncbi:MAG: T9SS type A sorting domain-containing protein [Candidatus Latescibacteria bacterium]|nr:T9SS type A sorting domain-containing protein [Candidatus Latescibacterota bacterium]
MDPRVGPDQEIEFGIAGVGLVGVKQFEIELEVIPSDVAWGISFTPAQGFISPGTVSEWFWDAETQTSGIRLKAGGGILGGPAVEGDLTLGTFALTTAPWFSAQTQATVRVTRLAVGSSSTEQDVFSAEELGLELGINREAVWHHRQVVLTEEPLDIFAQVPTSSLTLVQAEIHAGANDPPVATVELRDDGVAPDEEAGDQVYSGRWAGSEQVGQYSIDLVLEYSGGGQARRTGMDTFSIVHTIVSLPDLMLVSPEGLSTVRIPLLIEDHGSGYLSQGFLAAQFEVQMQGNGLEPSQPTLSLEGTGLEGQSFLLDTLVAQTAGGWKLKGALASTTPLHLSASPGPGQQGLAYVELSLRPDNPAGILPVTLNEALLEEDLTGVAIGCCGLVGLGRGDVDLNAHIESFDASLVLMHSVFMLNLDNPEDPLNDVIENRYEFTVPVAAAQMADVSGQLGVTAFDAALILQREVGLLTHFPSEEGYYRLWEPPAWWNPPTAPAAKPVATPAPRPLARVVSLGTPEEGPERVIVVPVEIDQMEGVLAGTLALSYEAQALQPVGVRATLLTQGYLLSDHAQGGQVWVSFAGPRWRAGSGAVMEVLFRRQGEGIGVLSLSQVQLNEEEVQVQEARLQTVSPVPRELALYPNYPNPFNPRTVIGYGLPAGGEVEVSVYNLAGQRVRRLWVGWQGVGVHQVEWDGRDEEGRVLSSGVYVCRLAVGQRVLVRKMLLVK